MARHFTPIGYTFKDERLLKAALTHRSCVCECFVRDGGEEHDNQRLEFLGDAVLELFISEHLFSLRPRLSEGAMSRVRACFVCEGKLAEIARGIGLGEHLVISLPEDNSGGRDKTSLLADAMEALLGAVFLDGGPEQTRRLILKLWSPYLNGCSESPPSISDYKTALQEFTQRCGMGLPVYSLANTVGPAHKPTFFISVRVGDRPPSMAMARSKKEAAQHAAKILLQELMDEEARCPRSEGPPDVGQRARGLEGLIMASDCLPRPDAGECRTDAGPGRTDSRPAGGDRCQGGADARHVGGDLCPGEAGARPAGGDICPGEAGARRAGGDLCQRDGSAHPWSGDLCPGESSARPVGGDLCHEDGDAFPAGGAVRFAGGLLSSGPRQAGAGALSRGNRPEAPEGLFGGEAGSGSDAGACRSAAGPLRDCPETGGDAVKCPAGAGEGVSGAGEKNRTGSRARAGEAGSGPPAAECRRPDAVGGPAGGIGAAERYGPETRGDGPGPGAAVPADGVAQPVEKPSAAARSRAKPKAAPPARTRLRPKPVPPGSAGDSPESSPGPAPCRGNGREAVPVPLPDPRTPGVGGKASRRHSGGEPADGACTAPEAVASSGTASGGPTPFKPPEGVGDT